MLFGSVAASEAEEQNLMSTTCFSREAIRASMRLTEELAKCTTMSTRDVWCYVRRFLVVLNAGYHMRKSMGLDPTNDLINLAVNKGVDQNGAHRPKGNDVE